MAFTAVFTVELLINMFAHWFRDFAYNSWYPPLSPPYIYTDYP